MSSIITFYSYKGGVGRSMSLANIAYELSKRQKKVLMVDWDLEAPGLERYFSNFKIEKDTDGLLQLLTAFRSDNTDVDYKNYIWKILTSFGHPIHLLHSGRDKNPTQYATTLENFKWDSFFTQEGGGRHLEDLRKQWLKDYDFVLIDSRTGLSDASGICTIMLPDVLIPMFTANYQSLFGIRDIISLIQAARQKLDVDRMALTILPIPSRFGTRVEFKESQEWLDRIADILKECFSDWLPTWVEPRKVLEQIKIPQVDYFSFGEKLAVVEQGTTDPEGMGFIYAKLADFLASDFGDVARFVGETYFLERKMLYEQQKRSANDPQKPERYKYDVFISYPRSVYPWVREVFVPSLKEYLQDELQGEPQLYFDAGEPVPGSSWNEGMHEAINSSKVFVFVLGDATMESQPTMKDLLMTETIKDSRKTVFPVVFRTTDAEVSLPNFLRESRSLDFSQFSVEALKQSTKLTTQFGGMMEQLSSRIADAIRFADNKEKPLPSLNDIKHEMDTLASTYEQLRAQMPSGGGRTRAMQEIVDKMKSRASLAEPFLQELMESQSPGKRLAAIAVLQEKPDQAYLDWLAARVGGNEKPFVGFQASVALYTAARQLPNSDEVRRAVETGLGNIERSNYKDPEQVATLNFAKSTIGLKRKRVFISYDYNDAPYYANMIKKVSDQLNLDLITLEPDSRDSSTEVDTVLKQRMKEASHLVVIVGEKTHADPNVLREIQLATQPDMNLKIAAIKTRSHYLLPPGLPHDAIVTSKFSPDSINVILDELG